MKILITGGCGFLGSNLASECIAKGIELIVFDNLVRHGSRDNLLWLQDQGAFNFVHGDIRNQNDVIGIIKNTKPDAIFHLAGQVAMTTSITNPRMDFEVNVIGTHNLLEAVRLHAPNASVLYSSTNKVYGSLQQFHYCENETRYECVEHPDGFDESTPLEFHSPYGCSKGAADQYMLDYARIFGLNTIVFRHSSMYGGRQFATYDQGWIGWFCQKAIETKQGKLNQPFNISGNGKQVRDILHVKDVIDLYFTALENINIAAGCAFNIGGGIKNSLSLLELFSLLSDSIGAPMKYHSIEPRISDQLIFVANIDRAKSTFKWSPKFSAPSGILNALSWTQTLLHE